jgi:hypothetical protein
MTPIVASGHADETGGRTGRAEAPRLPLSYWKLLKLRRQNEAVTSDLSLAISYLGDISRQLLPYPLQLSVRFTVSHSGPTHFQASVPLSVPLRRVPLCATRLPG